MDNDTRKRQNRPTLSVLHDLYMSTCKAWVSKSCLEIINNAQGLLVEFLGWEESNRGCQVLPRKPSSPPRVSWMRGLRTDPKGSTRTILFRVEKENFRAGKQSVLAAARRRKMEKRERPGIWVKLVQRLVTQQKSHVEGRGTLEKE